MSWLKIENLRKTYELENMKVNALSGVNLEINQGEFIVVVGRNGSGKTTLLNILAGLEEQSLGKVFFQDNECTIENPLSVGMVFQEARLMPWFSVERNLLFPFLPDKNFSKLHQKTLDLVKMLKLEGYENAMPSQLSSGMAQRVALGRALSYNPEIVLLDEPLGALDYFTRRTLQLELIRIYLKGEKTFLMVTHDVEEALRLATRVIVLKNGSIDSSIQINMEYPRVRNCPEFQDLIDKVLLALDDSEA